MKPFTYSCGRDHQWRSDVVMFYTDSRLSCGPRVVGPDARKMRKRARPTPRGRLLALYQTGIPF